MRHFIHTIALTFLTIVFAACSRTPDPRLLRAESLMELGEDSVKSALVILKDIPVDSLSGSDRHLLDLLMLKATDKAYRKHTSDSLALEVVEYYRRHPEGTRYPEALYLTGRTYSDMDRPDLAMRYYRMALKAGEDEGNPDLLACIHSQTAGLYFDNRLYRLALRHLKSQLRYCRMLPDSSETVNALLSLAFSYRMLNYRDSACNIYRYLASVADTLHDNFARSQYYTQYASFLKEEGKDREAENLIGMHDYTWNKESAQAGLNILNKFGSRERDTTLYVTRLRELSGSPDLVPRQQAARDLASYYTAENVADSALLYTTLYATLTDTILSREGHYPLDQVEHLLSESDWQNENLRLKADVQRRNFIVTVVILLICILLTVFYLHRIRSRARLAEKEFELTETKGRLVTNMEESEKVIKDRDSRLASLTDEISRMEIDLKKIVEDYSKLEQKYQASIKKITRIEKELSEKKKKLELNEADVKIKRILNRLLSENVTLKNNEKASIIEELIRLYNLISPDFIEKLNFYGINGRDFKDALLIRAGVPQKICACFLNISASGLSNSRSRLLQYKSLEDSFNSWSEFILSL